MVNQNTVFVDYETLPNGDVNYISTVDTLGNVANYNTTCSYPVEFYSGIDFNNVQTIKCKVKWLHDEYVGTFTNIEVEEARRLGYEIEELPEN